MVAHWGDKDSSQESHAAIKSVKVAVCLPNSTQERTATGGTTHHRALAFARSLGLGKYSASVFGGVALSCSNAMLYALLPARCSSPRAAVATQPSSRNLQATQCQWVRGHTCDKMPMSPCVSDDQAHS